MSEKPNEQDQLPAADRHKVAREAVDDVGRITKQVTEELAQERHFLGALLDNIAEAVVSCDSQGTLTRFNRAARELHGLPEQPIPPERWAEYYDLYQPDGKTPLRKDEIPLFRALHGEQVRNAEMMVIPKGGTARTLAANGQPMYDPEGKLLGAVVAMHDITERKRMEDDLKQREEKYRQLFDNMVQGVFYQRADGELVDVNAAALNMFGMTRDEFLGKTSLSYEWKVIDERGSELRGKNHPSMLALTTGEAVLNKIIGVFNHKRNEYVWVSVNAVPQFRPGEKMPYQVFVTLHDITERKQAEEQIYYLAFHDSLTRISNRRLLNDRLEQTMAASKRSGIYGALMFMDMDNFKPLNDTYGHEVGDLLLVEVARRISSCVREADTVARFGGDEFMVMLNELDVDRAKSASEAGIVAEKIRAVLAKPYVLETQHEGEARPTIEYHCTSSIGVVLFVGHEGSADEVVKWADIAMYQAKEAGGDQVWFGLA